MQTFKRKDFVQVVMANSSCFDFQAGETTFNARIEYIPGATSELWEFSLLAVSDHDANTTVIKHIKINPSAADFIGLVRTEEIDFELD